MSLVGLPGSGKSTAGRKLARRLQCRFTDTDQEVERRLHCSISEYFFQMGEVAFRDVEASVIEAATQMKGILSTGGGAVLREINREYLKQRSTVVYLHATPEDIFRRLRNDSQRPLLQVADPLQKLRELYAQRDPLYREVADFVIETGRPSVPALVNMIIAQLEVSGHLKA